MSDTPQLSDALPTADLLFDRATLEAAIVGIAARIDADYADDRPLFMTVMNGGMFFAAQLALSVRTDMEFDYLHATRYRGKTRGAGLTWLRHPQVPMLGRRVLLVDDILDEGQTLKAVREACVREGASEVRIAVLARKLHDRCAPGVDADYIGVDVPDRYVFGYGMDFHEQGRNLPGIYAI
ncbi:hypoxanthine-guanine phosphoribosyltransferase [Xanthomonadaceae bacterium JHOS43]|nr:hypoxanthine-guanine phosphoribosyltransferase [Xanthomonadaceae bacterium JHOS43]MCX7563369.1 hypoxanthine-guanine phosphoribosyltransferase [Xanthomonadaceae bacterium XH05]